MTTEQQPTDAPEEQAAEAAAEAVLEEITVESVQAELAAAQAQVESQQDEVLRAQAEVQNMRRRMEQDVAKAHKFGQEKLVNELLPIIDNLGRAVAACDDDNASVASLKEGVEMTLKMFADGLTKFNVVEIDPHGEPFDPAEHQAMTMVPNPAVEPNTVIEVMQKGYSLNGRLLRPAMVVVAKA